MKSYLSGLLALLVTCASFANEKSISAVKSIDGTVARCSEGADLGNIAHRLSIKSVKRTKVMTHMSVEINFLQCQFVGQKYQLISQAPNATYNHGVTFSDLAVVLADHSSQILTLEDLKLNQARQTVTFSFPTDIESDISEVFVRGLLTDLDGTALTAFGSYNIRLR